MSSAPSGPHLSYPSQAVLAPHPRNQVATHAHLNQINSPNNQYSLQGRFDLEAQQSSMNTPAERRIKQKYLNPNIVQSNRLGPWSKKGAKVFAFFAIPAAVAITIVGCYFGLNKDTHYKSH